MPQWGGSRLELSLRREDAYEFNVLDIWLNSAYTAVCSVYYSCMYVNVWSKVLIISLCFLRILYHMITSCTVNVEKFARLNFCRFKPNEVFVEKLLECLTFKILKQHHYTKLVYINKYSRKIFYGTFQKCESLIQGIFPSLRYSI